MNKEKDKPTTATTTTNTQATPQTSPAVYQAIVDVSTPQSVPNNTDVTVIFQNAQSDPYHMCNLTNGIFTIPIAGIYNMIAQVDLGPANGGSTFLNIFLNGNQIAVIYYPQVVAAYVSGFYQINCTRYFNVGDELTVVVAQTTGTTQNTQDTTTRASLVKIA